METKKETTSKITLNLYVKVLRRIGECKTSNIFDLNDIEERAARELIRSGFVSNKYKKLAF